MKWIHPTYLPLLSTSFWPPWDLAQITGATSDRSRHWAGTSVRGNSTLILLLRALWKWKTWERHLLHLEWGNVTKPLPSVVEGQEDDLMRWPQIRWRFEAQYFHHNKVRRFLLKGRGNHSPFYLQTDVKPHQILEVEPPFWCRKANLCYWWEKLPSKAG